MPQSVYDTFYKGKLIHNLSGGNPQCYAHTNYASNDSAALEYLRPSKSRGTLIYPSDDYKIGHATTYY